MKAPSRVLTETRSLETPDKKSYICISAERRKSHDCREDILLPESTIYKLGSDLSGRSLDGVFGQRDAAGCRRRAAPWFGYSGSRRRKGFSRESQRYREPDPVHRVHESGPVSVCGVTSEHLRS